MLLRNDPTEIYTLISINVELASNFAVHGMFEEAFRLHLESIEYINKSSFLDEMGEMTLRIYEKLLGVLSIYKDIIKGNDRFELFNKSFIDSNIFIKLTN